MWWGVDSVRRGRPALMLVLALALAPMRAVEAAAPAPAPCRPALVAADDTEDEEAARAALKEASAARRAAGKLEDEDERAAALLSVVDRYDTVSLHEPYPEKARAEAAFRAGEILRTMDRADDAETRFLRATRVGEEVEDARAFAARGLLERAHLRRRDELGSEALMLYAEVRERFADQRRQGAHAMTWTGKLLLRDGRRDEAAAQMRGFLSAYPEYPAEAVRNVDLLAVDLVEAGEEAVATETVDWIRRELEPLLAAGGKDAEAAQKALDGMRVTSLLAGY